MKTKKVIVALACAGALSGAAWAASGPGFDDPDNWPQYHRSFNAWRFSPLTAINRDNVGRLKVAWIHQPGNITHGIQATPIVIDGVLYYVSANNNVWAVDAASGRTLWHYEPKLDPLSKQAFYAAASRGVTVSRNSTSMAQVANSASGRARSSSTCRRTFVGAHTSSSSQNATSVVSSARIPVLRAPDSPGARVLARTWTAGVATDWSGSDWSWTTMVRSGPG